MPTTHNRQPLAVRRELSEVRSEISELRDKRAEARRKRDETRAAFWSATITGDVTASREFQAAEEAVRLCGEIDSRLEDATEREVELLSELGINQPSQVDETPNFLQDPQSRAQLQEMASTRLPFGRLALGSAVSRDQFAASLGRAAGPMFAAGDLTDVPSDASRRGPHAG